MKKFIILITLVILSSSAFSQSYSNVYMMESGTWNTYSETWMWDDAKNVDLTFTLSKTYVKINDRAHTYLSIVEVDKEVDDDDVKSTSWICRDEKNRRCIFTMMGFKEKKMIVYSIMYNDMAFRYYIRNGSKIDSFQNF